MRVQIIKSFLAVHRAWKHPGYAVFLDTAPKRVMLYHGLYGQSDLGGGKEGTADRKCLQDDIEMTEGQILLEQRQSMVTEG